MNINQILNMAMRLFMRKVLSRGINAGMDLAARRGGGGDAAPSEPLTPEERQRAREAKQTAKRARQAAKLGRRIGRF